MLQPLPMIDVQAELLHPPDPLKTIKTDQLRVMTLKP